MCILKNTYKIGIYRILSIGNITIKTYGFFLLQNQISKRARKGAFPDTYGMSAKKLAQLLNKYRKNFTN